MQTTQTQAATIENVAEAKKRKERDVKSILWNKFLDILENSTFRQMISVILLAILASILAVLLTYPKQCSEVIIYVLRFENYLFTKTIGSFIVIFNFKRVIEFVKGLIPNIPDIKKEAPKGQTIEGIPVIELLDHLFEFESFKREDIEKKFGIPRNRFTDLANKLEELCVLQRGENNSRILNKEFARSDIARILEGKSSAEDLRLVSRKIDSSTFTYEPAGRKMMDKVKEFLFPKFEELQDEKSPDEEFEDCSPLLPPSLTGFEIRKIGSLE